MRSQPVAGQVLEGSFIGGLSFNDLDVFIIPLAVLIADSQLPIPAPVFFMLIGATTAVSLTILWKAPRSQRPSAWARAKLKGWVSDRKYRNRPHERGYSEIRIQNELLTKQDRTKDSSNE